MILIFQRLLYLSKPFQKISVMILVFCYGSFCDVAHITSVIFRDEANDILAVGDWGQRLSFYQISGKQV